MNATQTKERSYVVTLAELCEALEDGRLASQRTNEYYTIRQGDLRRFAQSSEIKRLDVPRAMMDQFYVAG
jgi:hypothetical protein